MSSHVIPIEGDSWQIQSSRLLSKDVLATLNEKNPRAGWKQLLGHLAIMGISGYFWGTNLANPIIALPALVIYGFTLVSMFAPLHECVHRTAFVNSRVNDAVAWFAGLLSFYNSTFYRYYHKWHHRYTQIPDRDPELSDPKPTNIREYIVEISGFNWWIGKIKSYFRLATGQLEDCPFVSEANRDTVIRSVRIQLAVYFLFLAFFPAYFCLYWLLPLAVGQPILRAILLSEHTGCTNDNNPLTNTRTTLTLWPIRFLMWNMPYHAEHHLYPSIPFHQLAKAHEILQSHFARIEKGYVVVNRQIVGNFGKVTA
ncbi:fatty acid desaturase [Pannus brasiliensis CCIBt3594]|uniref:Fatty acid desaturase n=1 Tax=Pannus brasiliensis CCIBt3594 TaxID=1427578 RepID=A0AAW9QVP3_9CHRO